MKTRTFAVLAIVGLMVVGCTATGGGWMPGRYGGKATLGFSGECEFQGFQDPPVASLSFSYVDKSASPAVNIKGAARDTDGCSDGGYEQSGDPTASCYVNPNDPTDPNNTGPCDMLTFDGEYRPQPKGDRGWYDIEYIDTGVRGPSKGDRFTIHLDGGRNSGYTHEAVLGGGNIKVTFDEAPTGP